MWGCEAVCLSNEHALLVTRQLSAILKDTSSSEVQLAQNFDLRSLINLNMRERGQTQTVLDLPSPSSSTVTGDSTQSESESPVKRVDPTVGTLTEKKRRKKVNFSSPPKWKLKHVVGGGSKSSQSGRTALKSLHSNTKLLVGRGSPRIPTVGKGKQENSKLKQTVITFSSPLSSKKGSKTHTEEKSDQENVLVLTADQCTQTEAEGTSSVHYRMCTEAEPPLEYWRSLAEQRRVALAETLQENEQLYTEVDTLKTQVTELQTKVKDLEYFAMMYKLASKETS